MNRVHFASQNIDSSPLGTNALASIETIRFSNGNHLARKTLPELLAASTEGAKRFHPILFTHGVHHEALHHLRRPGDCARHGARRPTGRPDDNDYRRHHHYYHHRVSGWHGDGEGRQNDDDNDTAVVPTGAMLAPSGRDSIASGWSLALPRNRTLQTKEAHATARQFDYTVDHPSSDATWSREDVPASDRVAPSPPVCRSSLCPGGRMRSVRSSDALCGRINWPTRRSQGGAQR